MNANYKASAIYPWLIILIPAVFYIFQYTILISPEIFAPNLKLTLHINDYQLGWLAAIYTLAYVFMQIPCGLLLDRFRTHYLISLAILIYALGLLLFAHTNTYWIALVARIILGLSSSFAFISALKLTNEWLPENKYTLVVAILEICMALSAVAAAYFFVYYRQAGRSWETLFWQTGIILFALVFISFIFARDKKSMIVEVSEKKYVKELIVAIKEPQLWLAGLYIGFIFVSLVVLTNTWQITMLKTIHHIRGLEAVTVNSMVMFGFIAGALNAGIYANRFGIRNTLIFAGIGKMLALIGGIYFSSTPLISLMLLLNGFAIGLSLLCFTLAKQYVQRELHSFASALINMFCVGIGASILPFFSYLLDVTKEDFMIAIIPLYIANIIVVIVSFYIKEKK